MPMELYTISRQRSASTSIPSRQWVRRVSKARASMSMLWKTLKTITGSMTFSSSCPASAARVTDRSLPITWKATWFTTSGITGFTFPGMMLDPGARAGRRISAKPQRGPEERRRRSLQILLSFTATRLRIPDTMTRSPTSLLASTRSSASRKGRPVTSWSASSASPA